jgi:hypothetical protein
MPATDPDGRDGARSRGITREPESDLVLAKRLDTYFGLLIPPRCGTRLTRYHRQVLCELLVEGSQCPPHVLELATSRPQSCHVPIRPSRNIELETLP